MVRAHKLEQNLHYAQILLKKSANARNLNHIFHQKPVWGSTELCSKHFGQFLCATWTSFLLLDPKFI